MGQRVPTQTKTFERQSSFMRTLRAVSELVVHRNVHRERETHKLTSAS